MTVVERIREICRSKGIPIYKLEKDLGYGNGYLNPKKIVPIIIPQLRTALEAVEDKTGPVVTVAENTMLRHANLACERAGVTVVGNHGLRHSFASLGYHQGLSVRQLMDLGGWADYATMQRIYIRLAQSAKDSAPAQLAAFFKENGNEIGNWQS